MGSRAHGGPSVCRPPPVRPCCPICRRSSRRACPISAGRLDGWVAVAGPAGVPKPGVERAYQAVRSAVAVSEVRVALLAQGYQLQSPPPDSTAAFFRSEVSRMARLVKQSGLKLD